MATLKDWFGSAHPPITEEYNPPALSPVFSTERPEPVPPPQNLYDLGQYHTPFAAVWRRPKNVLQG